MELPYIADYAKSNRAICRGCSTSIIKDTLRVAIMLPSNSFDGIVPNWYHYQCFFIEHMPRNSNEIEQFHFLRTADKENIEDIIRKGESPFLSDDNNLKRAISKANSEAILKDFTIEYTKTSQTKCKKCENTIKNKEIRIMKKATKKNYYHLNCFVEIRTEIDFLEPGREISGFSNLDPEDQELVNQKLPGLCETPPKKKKISVEKEVRLSRKEKNSKDCNDVMFKYRDDLKQNLKKPELEKLLRYNKQSVPRGIENMLDRACDMLTYGALGRCSKCKGPLNFTNLGYKCSGHKNSWTKCNFISKRPSRTPIEIPLDLKLKYTFLYQYEFVPRKRIIPKTKLDSLSGPLCYKNIVIFGFSPEEKSDLHSKIKLLGGRVVSDIRRSVFAVISTQKQVELSSKELQTAKDFDVYVVSEEFIQDLSKNPNLNPDETARKNSLCTWGLELHLRIPEQFRVKPGGSNAFRKFSEEEETKRRRVKIKAGLAIEPDSGLDEIAHVYQSGGVAFNAVLSKTDVVTNINSYYKIQLLESDDLTQYWVYKGWGRIGTSSGSSKTDFMPDLLAAKADFKACFREKTGSTWENRFCMIKKPFLYTMVDVNYQASKEEIVDLNTRIADSDLKPEVAQLMAMIFNVASMEKMMLEYELDLSKMPLGKLSRTQIHQAYNILTEISWAIQRKFRQDEIIELTNKFYSFMPHNSNLDRPPLLDNKDKLKLKSDMLANLMELETAFSIIQREANGQEGNPLDFYYNQLNTKIDLVEINSPEFDLIKEYVNNTHGETHKNYDLKILDLFRVSRNEEPSRFEKFQNLPNRKLLFHGSRTTNFAGILSQGLRIAPPEAPVTGYMFGKGIYFADMVSKSANYCCTSSKDSEGLLLICEVALGNVLDKIRAEHIQRLPPGVHSVRGVGKTQPNPLETKTLEDGVQVPLGKPVNQEMEDGKRLELLYNEYIVYDVAQIQIKYLLKVDFKFKNRY